MKMTKSDKQKLLEIAEFYGSTKSKVMRTALHMVHRIMKEEMEEASLVKFTGVKHNKPE